MRLVDWMADKEPLWQTMIARYGLIEQPFINVAHWDLADFVLNQEHDVFYSMSRLRGAGFSESVDTGSVILHQIAAYRHARILP